MTEHVITANRLLDGGVVFLREDGGWDADIGAAKVTTDEAAGNVALEVGTNSDAANIVTGVYAIEVARTGTEIIPARLRERIRAYGPTTHRDFARADVPAHFTHPDGVEAVVFGFAN